MDQNDKEIAFVETRNSYAIDAEGNDIYILNVERGDHEYLCPSCRKPMRANKGTKLKYFQHIPSKIESENHCEYSNETYRHFLAKKYLIELKQIKVPGVYKYPPLGKDGPPMRLQESRFIVAFYAEEEVYFYEDEEGQIAFQKCNPALKEHPKFLIKPDVIFYDQNKKPILFIELCVTHKVNDEKLFKIKYLGIDTVQVHIPAESPEAIKRTFFVSENTEWIFNREQHDTVYDPNSARALSGIPGRNAFQRKLAGYWESPSCQKARIRDLISRIRICLGSEQYKAATRKLREEIGRIDTEISAVEQQLSVAKKAIEEGLSREFGTKVAELAAEEDRFREQDSEFRARQDDLVTRYKRKKNQLSNDNTDTRLKNERELREFESEEERVREEERDVNRGLKTPEELIRYFEQEERGAARNAEDRLGRERELIERERAAIKRIQTAIDTERERLAKGSIEFSPEDLADEADLLAKTGRIEAEEREAGTAFEHDRRKLEERFAQFRRAAVARISGESSENNPRRWFIQGIQAVDAARQRINDIA